MKKAIVCAIILLTALHGFTQEDSMKVAIKDLQNNAAKSVLYDGCKAELGYAYKIIADKDSTIIMQSKQLLTVRAIADLNKEEARIYKADNTLFTDQKEKIKRQKTTITILAILLGAAIIL